MDRASRSLRVHPAKVSKIKEAYARSGCFSQKDLAGELGLSPDTVSRFLNGHSVDKVNAYELCRRLSLDSNDFLILGNAEVSVVEPEAQKSMAVDFELMPQRNELAIVQPGAVNLANELADGIETEPQDYQSSQPIEAEFQEIKDESSDGEDMQSTSQDIRVEQEFTEEVEGVALGYVKKLRVNEEEVTRASTEDDSETVPTEKKESIFVAQKVNKIERTGIVIGIANSATIQQ